MRVDRHRLEDALWKPLDAEWNSDRLGRLLFGPPTGVHVLAGLVIGLLVALLYLVAG